MLAKILAGLLSVTVNSAGAMIESVMTPDVVIIAEADCNQTVEKSDLEAAVKVIDKRMEILDIDDVTVSITNDNKLKFESYDEETKDEIIKAITAEGEVEFWDADENPVINMNHISYAEVCFGQLSAEGNPEYYVQLYFTPEGRKAFKVATENAVKQIAEEKNYISIVVDGEVYSMPRVIEVIDAENCVVSGSFTKESANELALVINGGKMPFELKIVE